MPAFIQMYNAMMIVFLFCMLKTNVTEERMCNLSYMMDEQTLVSNL